MNNARKLKVAFGRDGFQLELVDDQQEGAKVSVLTFVQKAIRSLSWLVTGAAIANAIHVFKLF